MSIIAALRSALAISISLLCVEAFSQPYHPVPIPSDSNRTVIGTWRLVEPNIRCTRSIEQVSEQFYMVARCKDIAGVDGTKGFPLVKLSARVYKNQVGSTYEIQEDGMLHMVANGHIDMRGTPQVELWPE